MFSGSFVAIVTPFLKNKIDEKKFRELVLYQLDAGTQGIVPCGTTGEAATLSSDERERVFSVVVEAVNNKVPVVAGTGTNDTAHTIQLTRMAKKCGADAALVVTPYYNKPTQDGLFEHYKKISGEVDIPIIIYNVPGRTGVNILPPTVLKLMKECPTIVGIKEASGCIDQSTEIISQARSDFFVLSGDDSQTLPLMAVGARGVISVVANLAPRDVRSLCQAVSDNDWDQARTFHNKLYPLIKACFMETNPMPVKTALELMGLCSGEVRLPLCKMQKDNKDKLQKLLMSYGLLKNTVKV
ncbi:MAG: 4-hydroxy-tetrahydrodipicolinate synthase [bacterium]